MFFVSNEEFTERLAKGKSKGTSLSKLVRPKLVLRPFLEFGWDELKAIPAGSPMIYDVECYPNFFCVSFKCPETKKVVYFERSPRADFDKDQLLWMMFKFCTVGFHSQSYDLPMVFGAAKGFSNKRLKELSNAIIGDKDTGIPGLRPHDIQKQFGLKIPFQMLNQIDLIEVAPLEGSLKLYGARLQVPRLQDLPFEHTRELNEEEADIVKYYNINDDDLTIALYEELKPEIALRETLSKEYGQDLRSRSDAQIAEAVISRELAKLTGKFPQKPTEAIASVRYEAPPWVGFVSQDLRNIANAIEAAIFPLDGAGSPMWPEKLGELKVRIDQSVYKLGMGGLHSSETTVAHIATTDTLLIDRDVASYYPRIILNERLFPKHLGEAFLSVYEGLVNKRLAAKAQSIKTIANALKITINGGFGKFGNQFSLLYSPKLLLQVTITGQLALLMLIEMIEHHGIPVVSGNTDGVVIKCPTNRYEDLLNIVAMWEQITGFETEETRYKALYCRDVNNYYAVKEKGDENGKYLADRLGIKVKGVYSEVGSALNSVLSKNAEHLICSDAVLHAIASGKPIKETIEACKDIRRFSTVRQVSGGAQKNGEFIGKVIRWYYAKNCPGVIRYITNGNAVGKSEGAKPLMDLPPELPTDIDYDWYINKADEILEEIGFKPKKQAALFF